MSEEVPQWAIERVSSLSGLSEGMIIRDEEFQPVLCGLINAFARYIAAHEQPPVDPALVWARDLIADAVGYGAGICVEPERKKPSDFRSGDCDDGDLIRRAVEGYRKHKEAGE